MEENDVLDFDSLSPNRKVDETVALLKAAARYVDDCDTRDAPLPQLRVYAAEEPSRRTAIADEYYYRARQFGDKYCELKDAWNTQVDAVQAEYPPAESTQYMRAFVENPGWEEKIRDLYDTSKHLMAILTDRTKTPKAAAEPYAKTLGDFQDKTETYLNINPPARGIA